MDLPELGESGLIRRIRMRAGGAGTRVARGIGDDAAATRPTPEKLQLVTCDFLVEGVHFDLDLTTPEKLGKKALAVNLSDIAAMGGEARHFLVFLGLPRGTSVNFVDALYRGMLRCARPFGVGLVGGDCSLSPRGVSLGITVIGDVPPGMLVRRDTARPGDGLYVTGTLGDAALALHLFEKGGAAARRSVPPRLAGALLDPPPRLREGYRIASGGFATAMIDLSDGLLSDVTRLCEESGVGAEIHAGTIPLSASFRRMMKRSRKDLLDLALAGGEDYELLFSSRRLEGGSPAALSRRLRLPVTRVGTVKPRSYGLRVLEADGSERPTRMLGYDHFRARDSRRRALS